MSVSKSHSEGSRLTRSPSSPSSSRALVSAPVPPQFTDRIAKETTAAASHQSATLLSLGQQSFVMLPPHTSLNVTQDVLESNLEFAHNDFNAHYGDQQNMFLFTQNPFLPELGNKLRHRDLCEATELAQREKYSLKERLTPVQDENRGHKNTNALSVISSGSRYNANLNSAAQHQGFARPSSMSQFEGGSAMLSSTVYAGDGDLLNEGGLEVGGSTPGGFNSFDSLLGNSNSNSIRLPDLLDSGATLRLSPNAFDPLHVNTFEERSPLNQPPPPLDSQRDSGLCGGVKSNSSEVSSSGGSNPSTVSSSSSEKLKAKGLGGVKGNKSGASVSPSGERRVGTQPCPTCGKVFSNSSALTKHKLTHSDERKFVCQLCAKAFKRQDHLNGHMLTHRNKKPYECDVGGCGKSYCDARSLRRHKENHHNNNNNLSHVASNSNSGALVNVQIANLNLNSIQSAFAGIPRHLNPNNVNVNSAVATSEHQTAVNRIRYAPPLAQEASTLSQLLGSILPSAATQLQFLAFQQAPALPNHPNNTHHQNSPSPGPPQPIHPPHQITLTPQHHQLGERRFGSRQTTEGNRTESPTNSSQAMDLTSVAPPTNTTSSRIVTVTQAEAETSWTHNFQSLMNEAFEESLKRSKEGMEDRSSSNNNIVRNDSRDTLVGGIKIEDATSSSAYHVGGVASFGPPAVTRDSSPHSSGNNLPSVLDYPSSDLISSQLPSRPENDASSRQRIVSGGGRDPDINSSVVKKETERTEEETAAPLLQQLLAPDAQRSGQNKENVEKTGDNTNSDEIHSRSQRTFNSIHQDSNQEDWNTVSRLPADSVSLDSYQNSSELSKCVECGLCQRKFKTVPALNGHMRLHGGYYKKTGDDKLPERVKKCDRISPPTLQTASVNVRALIEEKIIQKQQRRTDEERELRERENLSHQTLEPTSTSDLPFIAEESYTLSIPDEPSLANDQTRCLLVVTSAGENQQFSEDPAVEDSPFEMTDPSDLQNEPRLDLVSDSSIPASSTDEPNKTTAAMTSSSAQFRHQFRVPRPVVAEKHRRHSDSDHFVSTKRPCTDQVASFLRRKVASRRATRTGSDPGSDFNQFFAGFLPDFDLDLTDFNQGVSQGQAESLPTYPRVCTDFFSSSFPNLPGDSQCNTQFSFLERDLVLSSLDNPQLPNENEFLVYADHSQERNLTTMESDVFEADDTGLMENPYASLCSGINALLEDPTPDTTAVASTNLNPMVNLPTVVDESRFANLEAEPPAPNEEISVPPTETAEIASTIKKEEDAGTTKVKVIMKEEVKSHQEGNGWPSTNEDPEDDVFLSPTSVPASPVKPRVKHRPEPLFIPPHVNTGVFTSRLRSPRLREFSLEQKTLSPPPYTPPPMLSPVRNGPGLFWHILSASSGGGNVTPKSAPITPNFLSRKISLTDEPLIEDEVCDPPETDIKPHVNIGSQFQAQLPRCRDRKGDPELARMTEKADRLWHPSVIRGIPDEDVEAYLEVACTACVSGGGRNKEYALHVLQLTRGDVREAVLRLMDPRPRLPPGHPLLTYAYLETEKWFGPQADAFQRALIKFDKDFFSISKELGCKSVKQCVEFYYQWKKIHSEEYKKLRTLRRKREQESLFYNLRPKATNHNNNNDEDETPNNNNNSAADIDDLSAKMSFTLPSPGGSPMGRSASPASTAGSEIGSYPCKICGRTFPKVKSRSAHMKSHRQTECGPDKSGVSNAKIPHFQTYSSNFK